MHACRVGDLPYWIAPALYEIELDGDVRPSRIKVIAPRGRLVRRIRAWNDGTRKEYAQMCIARAGEFAASRRGSPSGRRRARHRAGPALLGFVAARIAEAIDGIEAYVEERARQSAWLADRLHLDDV